MDEIPAHPNFETLGIFAEMRDAAPKLPMNLGNSVVFLTIDCGTFKILNGRIFAISFEKYYTQYALITRSGKIFNFIDNEYVFAV